MHVRRFDCGPVSQVAAVSIYFDGSVLVTHGGLEVGQGLSTKVKQVRLLGSMVCRSSDCVWPSPPAVPCRCPDVAAAAAECTGGTQGSGPAACSKPCW